MLLRVFVITFLCPVLAFGFCPFPQQNFPTQQQDEQHATGVRIRELQTARSELARQMPQINSEIQKTRNSLGYYLKAPWANAVIAHMDNGFDCCDSSRTAAMAKKESDRSPAGADYDKPVEGGSEIVDPMAYYDDEPEAYSAEPTYETPQAGYSSDTSCYGYPQEFCQPRWGKNDSPSKGGLCLQTGFAATNAWYNASCRSGGRVNPGICGDARISHYPYDYEQCVQILNQYYRLSRAKRQMSGQLQSYNDQIKTLNQNGRSFGSAVGSFLRAAGPFLLMYAISQQSKSSVRQQYQSYPSSYGGYSGSIGQPNSLSGRYGGSLGSSNPPNFYGADYGHPFQSGGMMGQLLPAMMSGAFGCSGGSGSGLDSVLPMLLGGGGLGGLMQPYQPGGINGPFPGTPGGNYNSGDGWVGTARPRAPGQYSGYLGQERNAVFYDMMGNARQRMQDSAMESNQVSNYMMSGLGLGGGTSGNPMSLPGLSFNMSVGSSFAPGMDSNGLIQSILMGGSNNTNFGLQSVPAGF